MLLFHVKKKALTKVAEFSKFCYHTEFEDPALNGTSVAPTSQVCIVTRCLYYWW